MKKISDTYHMTLNNSEHINVYSPLAERSEIVCDGT